MAVSGPLITTLTPHPTHNADTAIISPTSNNHSTMMTRSFTRAIIFTLLRIVGANGTPFVPHSGAISTALAVRGGDHLDPTQTAQAGILLAGLHSTLTLLSPSRTAEVYGTTSTPTTEFLSQWQASIVLSFCLQAWQLIVNGSDLNAAIVIGSIPIVLMQTKVFWNDDCKKLGMKVTPQLIGAVLAPLTMYACYTNASYVDTLLKLSVIWGLLNGFLNVLAPSVPAYSLGLELTPETKSGCETMGWLLLGLETFLALNIFTNVSPMKAFGYSWIPTVLMQISDNFIKKKDMAKAPSYVWLLIDVIMVTVCGFDNSGEHHTIHSTL